MVDDTGDDPGPDRPWTPAGQPTPGPDEPWSWAAPGGPPDSDAPTEPLGRPADPGWPDPGGPDPSWAGAGWPDPGWPDPGWVGAGQRPHDPALVERIDPRSGQTGWVGAGQRPHDPAAPTTALPRPTWGQPLPDDSWLAGPPRRPPGRTAVLVSVVLAGVLVVGSLASLGAYSLLRERGPAPAAPPTTTPAAVTEPAVTGTSESPPASEAATTRAGEEVGLGNVRAGDCYDEPEGAGDSVATVDVVPCGQAHDAEVYAIVPVNSRRLPDDDALNELGDRACAARFRPYVGVPLRDSTLDFTFFTPTRESWEAGDRTIICVLGDPDGDPVEGSMRGARR